jgi:hypothetical protein
MAVCDFTAAGPMVLSGMYEALLDARILNFITPRSKCNLLTAEQNAQLLLLVLVGNLDIIPAWEHSREQVWSLLRDLRDPPEVASQTQANSSRLNGTRLATGGGYVPALAIKAKLASIINSQTTFGSTIGDPIFFFVAGFVYTVVESQTAYGEG